MNPAAPLELGLTILAEAPIAWLLAGAFGADRRRALLVCCLVNIATQPLLDLAVRHFPAAGATQWRLAFAGCELVVCVVEALVYFACLKELRRSPGGVLKAFAISLAANGASAALGLTLPI